ncbi:sulfur carrier protein ThiS [Pseudoalteromonas pernae]|uniref:sulfur carrier protein ThiS n=1 Tax=Pseudoalteromonas pernae TaxID=3118054 RepID=UPI003242DEF6
MQIFINDEVFLVSELTSAEQAIAQFDAKPPFALALNGQFVAQQDYAHTQLKAGDRIDILSPIQGG